VQTHDLVCARQEWGVPKGHSVRLRYTRSVPHAAPNSWFPTIAQNGMSFSEGVV
jgi:hypothetical protein